MEVTEDLEDLKIYANFIYGLLSYRNQREES
jgi:hypothetical protein